MSLPISSGFFTGDIPAKVRAPSQVSGQTQRIYEQPAPQKTNTDYVKTSQEGVELAKEFAKANATGPQYSQTIYDQPSAQVSKAISTYTEFANLERRAEVQNLIGVDIYA